jgi:hypothetical protein
MWLPIFLMLMQIITMGEDFAFVHFIFIQKKISTSQRKFMKLVSFLFWNLYLKRNIKNIYFLLEGNKVIAKRTFNLNA